MTAKAFDPELDRLSLENQRAAFYYGFARHSLSITQTVAFIRGIKTDFWTAFFCDESGEMDPMANHHLIDITVWLARCDGFPLLSFRELSNEQRRQLMNPPTDSPIIFNTRGANQKPHETELRCRINWLATDREIEETFKRHIRSIRPEDFKKRNTTKAPDRGTVGFGPHRFPFRFVSAVNWLRKFEEKGSKPWGRLFRDQKYQVKGKTMADQKRQWQRDVRKAARILEWFETGKELRVSDFKR